MATMVALTLRGTLRGLIEQADVPYASESMAHLVLKPFRNANTEELVEFVFPAVAEFCRHEIQAEDVARRERLRNGERTAPRNGVPVDILAEREAYLLQTISCGHFGRIPRNEMTEEHIEARIRQQEMFRDAYSATINAEIGDWKRDIALMRKHGVVTLGDLYALGLKEQS